jgi:hypothetical protein
MFSVLHPSQKKTLSADCSSDVFVHGPVLRVDVHGSVHAAGREGHRAGLRVRGDLLRRVRRRGRRGRARRQEVRAGLADRVPGHRHHGAQHGDRHLLRRAGCLDAVRQRSVHGIQAALLTSSPGVVVGYFWLGLWAL